MSFESPFKKNRFEYERKHLYFLPSETYSKLAAPVPTLLVGSRGSGKTTLLQALSWRERTSSDVLSRALGEEGALDKFLGVYFKVPEIHLQLFDAWLRDQDTVRYSLVFSLFIELLWCELILDGIASLLAAGIFTISPKQEHVIVTKIVDALDPTLKRFLDGREVKTAAGLHGVVTAIRKDLERDAKLRTGFEHIVDRFPLDQVGGFCKYLADSLLPLCVLSGPRHEDWHFKVCMDEGECFSANQLKVINTLMRVARDPIYVVLSLVSYPPEATLTVHPNLTIQSADRQTILLDSMDDREFKALAEGVASVRAQVSTNNPLLKVDIDHLLGTFGINYLLERILANSVSPEAKEWLKKAAEFKASPFAKECIQGAEETSEKARPTLPIYETYLTVRLKLRVPEPGEPRWQRRGQESREIRKKMVAAYLAICNEINADVRYASAPFVLQMSDLCMRDFLSQLEEIFVETQKPLESFLAGEVSWGMQDAALKRASRRKREAIASAEIDSIREADRLVDALAKITRIVQTRGSSASHLTSSERGIFEVAAEPEVRVRYAPTFTLIRQAGEAGFLKILSTEGAMWRFRVHTSLAADYGFSYRGAYYGCKLRIEDVERIRRAGNSQQHDSVVRDIGMRLAGEFVGGQDAMELFPQV